MKKRCLILSPPNDKRTSKNVIRDFLYGCWCNGRRIGGMQMPPLNLLYIATVLKEAGFPIEFLDASMSPERFELLEAENFANFDIVIMLVATHSYEQDASLLREIKSKNPKIKVIICGAHPTCAPTDCLVHPAIDFIVLKEPEFPIRNLVEALSNQSDYSKIPGIGYKDENGKSKINQEASKFSMDELPIPDRSLLPQGIDYFNPVVRRYPYTTMQTSRGCVGRCIFCLVPSFYGNKVRVRSFEKVKEEILHLVNLGYKEIFFRDETFTAFKVRNRQICQWIIDNKIDITWIANARVDFVDRDSLILMKKAGCHTLKIGVESGDDEILKSIRKGTTVKQAIEAFNLFHEVGVDTHAHMIIGSPGETHATIKKTMRFLKKIRPTTASFGILTPYIGTPLFDFVKEQMSCSGTEADLEKLHVKSFYNHVFGCHLSSEELERWVIKCYRSFYYRLSYILHWIPKIVNPQQFMRLLIAGLNILIYSIGGKK